MSLSFVESQGPVRYVGGLLGAETDGGQWWGERGGYFIYPRKIGRGGGMGGRRGTRC